VRRHEEKPIRIDGAGVGGRAIRIPAVRRRLPVSNGSVQAVRSCGVGRDNQVRVLNEYLRGGEPGLLGEG
jgi:hypothetical protein